MKRRVRIAVGALLEVVALALLVYAVVGAVVLVLLQADGEAFFNVANIGIVTLTLVIGVALAVAGWRLLHPRDDSSTMSAVKPWVWIVAGAAVVGVIGGAWLYFLTRAIPANCYKVGTDTVCNIIK